MGAALSSDTYSSNVLERRLLGGAVSRRPAEPAARHGAHAHVRRHPVRSSLCSDVHRVRVRMTYLQRRPRPHARTQVSPNVAQLVVLRRTFFPRDTTLARQAYRYGHVSVCCLLQVRVRSKRMNGSSWVFWYRDFPRLILLRISRKFGCFSKRRLLSCGTLSQTTDFKNFNFTTARRPSQRC